MARPIDPREGAACFAEIDSHIDFYLDDGNELPGTYCVLVKRVLESFSDSEQEAYRAFGRGVATYIDVANFAEANANQADKSQPRKRVAVDQEREWSDKALTLIASWRGDPKRDMFAALGPKPPLWVDDWLARRA